MTALYILAALLLILFLLGQVRVGCRAEYGARGFYLWARLGPLSIQVLPWKKNPKQEKKKRERSPKKKKTGEGKKPSQLKPEPTVLERLGGALDYAQSLLPLILEAAGCFYRRLQVDKLYLEVTAAAADPADAALAYGRAYGVMGAFWTALTQAFHVRDGQGKVSVDFDAPAIRVYCSASLSIKIGQALWLGLFFGFRALRQFLRIRKEKDTEQKHRKAA